MSTLETRHYIGVTELGRLHMTLGPDEPEKFKTPPTEPLTLGNGQAVYPVSSAVAEEFDHDDEWDSAAADVAEEWTRGLADGKGHHVVIRRDWPELAKFLDALTDA